MSSSFDFFESVSTTTNGITGPKLIGLGGVLLGGTAPDRWIRWLAVRSTARRQGIGATLILEVLRRWPGPCTISLATFGADNSEGLAARRLYARHGFTPRAMLPRGPEGGTRQLYVLDRP